MTDAEDMAIMVALADLEVDKLLGGHTDAILATLFSSSTHLRYINSDSVPMKHLFGLLGELFSKVFTLENAP